MSYLRNGPQQINGVTGAFLGLSWLTVASRCYVRAVMIRKFGSEDWLSLASLVLFTVYCAFTFEGAQTGMGKMVVDLPDEKMMLGLRAWWFCGIFYVATSGVIKASITFQLLNLTDNKIHRKAIYAVFAVSTTFSAAFFLFLLFQCTPIDHFWMGFLGELGTCIKPQALGAFTISHSIINISADWFFAVLPCILVKGLNLPSRTKVTVSVILALGGLASCAVLIRLPYILILERKADELLYYCTWVINCSTAENGLGISAAALATLRPLFRSFLTASRNQELSSNCLQFGVSSKHRLNSQVGLSTIQKKILKGPDGTLRVIDDPDVIRSHQDLADLPNWLSVMDNRQSKSWNPKRGSAQSAEDRVIQKL